ncbi:hypothetical protein C8J57DRAFT_668142 [Mycena rebaudengoi]|nr:hypothetical protein C8J57DRAFT_668142 [Mycena rebaudengoi]
MHVPQELVNAIIDSAAQDLQPGESWLHCTRSEPPAAITLRACALVSRSFTGPSRMHLFAFINCWNEDRVRKFARLLLESPHIGPLYVRHSCLRVSATVIEGLPNALLCLSKLTHFELIAGMRSPHRSNLVVVKVTPRDILSTSSLRSLVLTGVTLGDVDTFTALLNQSPALEELCLDRVKFSSLMRRPAAPTIVIPHLRLTTLTPIVIEIVLSVLDATHLRLVDLDNASIYYILNAHPKNLRTLRAMDFRQKAVDHDTQSLQSIDIVDELQSIVVAFEDFGNLQNLKALKMISLFILGSVL